MTSIYLVEDEIYALKALQQKIMDLEEDYTIAGTADNGVTALEEITVRHPDIVLTDIRMPDMDGLTLIARLKEAGCGSLPIIISGYQDFEYAKQAIRLGAFDYLLKPVNPAELKTCLKNCVSKLEKKRKNIVSFLIGEETLDFEYSQEENSITLLYIIVANPLTSVENPLHPNVLYLPNAQAEQIFKQYHACQFQRCYDGFFSNEKVFLISGDKKSDTLLEASLPHFIRALQEETQRFVTIYYTRASRSDLPTSIRRCRNYAVQNVVIGQNTIASTVTGPPSVKGNLQETTELFSLMISQSQFNLLRSNIDRLFQTWGSESRTLTAVSEDMLFIINLLKRKYASRKNLDVSSHSLLENIISFSTNTEELAENFYNLLVVLFSNSEPENHSPDELVESLVSYFHEHLSSNITLQDLEELTGFSKVYICRVFKKVKNTTPIDYVTRLKIAQAKDMLLEFPGLSLREIADSLGFNDVYYFSKVFKRITGHSPSELRT